MKALDRLRETTRAASLLAACEPASHLQVSRNSKTGVSLNVPIIGTCTAMTQECARYCYGECGPIAMRDSVRLQARNLEVLKSGADPIALADDLAAQCRAARADFLRVNGVGDLTAESARVVAALAERHLWLTLWITTRRPDLARTLPDLPNVHIMLSTDRSTAPRAWLAMRALCGERPRTTFLAYTQLDAHDTAPADVAIVFQLHYGSRRATWPADARSCAATVANGAEHDGACAACRRCFDTERRLAR